MFDPHPDTFINSPTLIMADDVEAEEGFITSTPPWPMTTSAKVAPGSSLEIHLPFEAPASRSRDGSSSRFG
jgi:hypothetical protein